MKKDTVSCPLCHSDNPADTFFCGKCGTKLGIEGTPQYSKTLTMIAPAPELKRGQVFAGRYEVIEELGRGGMGSVYRVEDKKVNEEIALKLINPEIAQDKKIIDRFSHELKVARQISHRNVCRMYDLSEAEGTHFITMEYVQGEDLRSLLKRIGRLPEDKALAIARQVADGLAEAHHLGVVHRDLKPGNIMVDREGNAKVMDFGIARSTKAKVVTATGMIVGTPDYMSPEQAEAKEVDGRSDIYSLGVILYEMTTGQLPFEGETALAVAMKHKSERPRDPRDFNSQLSIGLSRLILKCLEKDKEKRFPSASELSAELRALEGAPIAERMRPRRTPVPSREITVTFKLRKFLVPALAVVVLAGLGVVLSRVILKSKVVERSVGVVSFQNQTGDPAYDYLRSAIPNLLITSLEQSKYLQVTTFERLRDLLRQQGKAEVETIDGDLGFELCRQDNVEALVLGSYVKAGETFATDVKIFDVKTRKMMKSFTAQGVGAQSILEKQIGELSRQISRGVGLSKRAVDETVPQMAQAPTKSMEAYKYYLEGQVQDEKQYYQDARKNYEKAIELDPEFASAYLGLSQSLVAGDTRDPNEMLKKAKELSAKAPEKDRLYIEAEYARRIEKDPEKRFRILQEIADRYPKEEDTHSLLVMYYKGREMYPEAIAEAEKGLSLNPKSPRFLNHLGLLYVATADFAKAEEIFKRAVAVAPGDANPLDSLGEYYYMTGRLDEAIDAYSKAIKIKPDFGFSGERIAYIQAVKGDYSEAISSIDQFILMARVQDSKGEGYWWKAVFNHLSGRRYQAKTEMDRLRGYAASIGNELGQAITSIGQGLLCFDRTEYDQALRYFEEGFETMLGSAAFRSTAAQLKAGTSIQKDLFTAFVAVKKNRIETARQMITVIGQNLGQLKDSGVLPLLDKSLKILQAEVMISEGRPDEAVALLEGELKLSATSFFIQYLVLLNFPYDQDVLARANVKLGNIDKAIEEYQKLLNFDPKGQDRRMHNPVYHYRLAKLYDARGLTVRAKAEYKKLLDDWKDADPGIPELVDAKKRT